MNDSDKNLIRRETGVYLGDLPDIIEKNPQQALSSACLAIGKYLRWIAPVLEKGEKEPICPGLPLQPSPIGNIAEALIKIGVAKFHQNQDINFHEEFAGIRSQLRELIKKGGEK